MVFDAAEMSVCREHRLEHQQLPISRLDTFRLNVCSKLNDLEVAKQA